MFFLVFILLTKQMETIDKKPYTLSFHSHYVIDPQRFIEQHDDNLGRPHWKNRIGVEKFDNIEKVNFEVHNNREKFIIRNPQEIVIIYSPTKDIEVEIDGSLIAINKGQSFIFPNCFQYIRIVPQNQSDCELLQVRSVPIDPEFVKLFYYTDFYSLWPFFGTDKFVCHRKGHLFVSSVSDRSDLIGKFVFNSIQDAPVFKLIIRNFDYRMIEYCALDIYVELSKWKRMGVEENHGEKIHTFTIYSKQENLLQLLSDKELERFSSDETPLNLTFPSSCSFKIKDELVGEFKTWLESKYPFIPDVHLRTEVLPTKEELETRIEQIKQMARHDKNIIEKGINLLKDWNLIEPIVLHPEEELKTLNFSKEVWDIIFNPKYATHDFLKQYQQCTP
jgi:hypothetical protein